MPPKVRRVYLPVRGYSSLSFRMALFLDGPNNPYVCLFSRNPCLLAPSREGVRCIPGPVPVPRLHLAVHTQSVPCGDSTASVLCGGRHDRGQAPAIRQEFGATPSVRISLLVGEGEPREARRVCVGGLSVVDPMCD
jgi:hypothetical protein